MTEKKDWLDRLMGAFVEKEDWQDWQTRLMGSFMIFAGLLVITSGGQWWGAAAGICIGLGVYRILGRRGF